jgi:DNA-binding FadR family transcriptional regulator
VALLAAKADSGDVAALRQLVAEGKVNERDPIAFARTASALHRRVVELTRNAPLSLLAAIVAGMTDRMYEASVATRPRRFADSGARLALRSWERLIDLIEQGDAEGAERHWREHMAVVGTNPSLSDAPPSADDPN